MNKKLVCGVGINDADYAVKPEVDGKRTYCPFYVTWSNMLSRCYDAKYQAKYPTYIGCSVSLEWRSFMAFKFWMEQQEWRGNALDKDLLISGNKTYSPDTCVFVSLATNNFTTENTAARGDCPIGVSWHGRSKRYEACCRNPFIKKKENLGYFDCPNEAHLAWKKRKHELACQLAELQADGRVANALRLRYL